MSGHFACVIMSGLVLLHSLVSGHVAIGADPFMKAVRAGDLERVKKLVRADPNLVKEIKNKHNPLFWAVVDGRLRVAEFLLSEGANAKAIEERGTTLLFKAQTARMAKLLLRHGADRTITDQYSQTALDEAARRRHMGVVNALLEAGDELNFDQAVELGETAVVARLLQQQPWLAKPPSKPLYYAASQGNRDLTELLLRYGADPDIDFGFANVSGPCTPLTNAVRGNHFAIAKLLLEQDASPNVSGGRNHDNLFLYAIAYREAKFTKLMLDHGAEFVVHKSWHTEVSPLAVASALGGLESAMYIGRVGQPASTDESQRESLQKVRYLLEAGAPINRKLGNGATALLHAAIAGNKTICDYLLANGAELDTASACILKRKQDVDSILNNMPELASQSVLSTPLIHWAVRSGDVGIVESVLDHRADIDASAPELTYQDASGFSARSHASDLPVPALHVAIQFGYKPIVRLLLDRGVNIKLKSGAKSEPKTTMDVAFEAQQWEVVKWLLDLGQTVDWDTSSVKYNIDQIRDFHLLKRVFAAGGDFTFDSEMATDLLAEAYRQKDQKLINYLMQRGTKLDILNACQLGQIEAVRRLIEAEPNALGGVSESYSDQTPLELAVWEGHLDVVRLAFDRNEDLTQPKALTELAYRAAESGNLAIIEFLSTKGLRFESVSRWRGNTLLHGAASRLQPNVVRYLIEQGLDVDASNFALATPLGVLGNECYESDEKNADVMNRAFECASALVAAGADVNAIDQYDSTPLHQASSQGYVNVGELLLSRGANVNSRNHVNRTPLSLAGRSGWGIVPQQTITAMEALLRKHGGTQ